MILVSAERSQILQPAGFPFAALTSFCIRHDILSFVPFIELTTGRCSKPVTEHTGITLLFLPIEPFTGCCAAFVSIVFRRILQCCPGINYLNETRHGRTFPPSTLQTARLWDHDQAGRLVVRGMRQVSHARLQVIRKHLPVIVAISPTSLFGIMLDGTCEIPAFLIGIPSRRGDFLGIEVGSGYYNEERNYLGLD